MKVLDQNMIRLEVVQHLRVTYGLKTKNWNKNKTSSSKLTPMKVFGVALDSLPHCNVLDYGDIPCFLVDVCASLMEHVQTEGLFRKSGSIVRLKALRAKLDQGEECLSTALPLDVAGLLKQFFRELPEPILPAELHGALLKAQELPTQEERTSATMLLSCVLPDRNLSTMRYFFSFLKGVSQRCGENKMDSSNLSVIFAPNLLHAGEWTEKMNSSTEKRLKLQAAVVHCLIENAQDFGVVPQFLMEKVTAMLGCEAGVLPPPADGPEGGSTNLGVRKSRRSLGVFSSATPVIMTPNTKRKLPLESGQSYGFSNKKRRSIKKNLGLELIPNALFGAGSTPGSAHSAAGTLDSQNALSSTGRTTRQSASSARRKSKRMNYRNVSRVESGKAGCFSPRVAQKEAGRKSLRLRFSLGGRSSRDASIISHSLPVPKGSEAIGWRLATQESTTSFRFTKETAFSLAVLKGKSASKGSKYISKSEDNLLTPQCEAAAHGTSWSGVTPDRAQPYGGDSFSDSPVSMRLTSSYYSKPAVVTAKPPVVGSIPKTLCCATSAGSSESADSFEDHALTGPTLLRIRRAFGESGSDLCAVVKDHRVPSEEAEAKPLGSRGDAAVPSGSPALKSAPLKNKEGSGADAPRKGVEDDPNVTFGQIEIMPLSPLHIDSALFEPLEAEEACDVFQCANGGGSDSLEEEEEEEEEVGPVNFSRLIDALDIQSPVAFRLSSSVGVQSTPYRATEHAQELNTPLPHVFKVPSVAQEDETAGSSEPAARALKPQPPSPGAAEARRLRVAEHIQRFNTLTLSSPHAKAVRSPLKFHRTPVRQSVRRINSLLGQRRPARAGWCATPVAKAVSLETGFSTGAQLQPLPVEDSNHAPVDKGDSKKIRPPVPPKKPGLRNAAKHCALGDVTNKVPQRAKGDTPLANRSGTSEATKSVVLQVAEKDMSRYRGSPRNPLAEGRLLTATKPIDL